jgi:DNA-binding response OmpR family regulator
MTMNGPDTIYSAGGIVINDSRHIVTVDGKEVYLTPNEYRLLRHLAAHPGHVFSEQDLLYDVLMYDVNTDSTTVRAHITRMRAKIDPERKRLKSIRSFGYKLEDAA